MLVVVPLVRGRTLRLTNRRLEAAIPLLMTELKADKSVLPAEFVMSTQRPETNVEQLKTKSANQLVERSKKGDAINNGSR